MTAPANRGLRRSFITIVVICILMNVAVLMFGVRSVNQIRGDFCTFAVQVHDATKGLPQVPARVRVEAAYTQLHNKLGC